MSFGDLLLLKLIASRRGFDEDFVKAATRELLLAVDFLHTEVDIIHTRGLLSESLEEIPR